jgi:hypothetical protein
MDQETIKILITAGAGLLGALIGGTTTFITPLVVEKTKYKRQKENEKLKPFYIPLSKSIEQLIENMNNYLLLPDNALNFDKLYELYSECKKFLNAEYRLQLPNGVLKKLKFFCDYFDLFFEELVTNASNYYTDIEQLISNKMISEDIKDEFCEIDLFDDSSNSVKRMFITNKFISCLQNIKTITVVLKMEIDGEMDYSPIFYNTTLKDNPDNDPDIDLENDLAHTAINILESLKTSEKQKGEEVLKSNTLHKTFKTLIKEAISLKTSLYKHIDKYK